VEEGVPIIWQSGSDNKEQGKNKPGHVRSMAGRFQQINYLVGAL
jgi:hypothetical protein